VVGGEGKGRVRVVVIGECFVERAVPRFVIHCSLS
jgi:hypothetical protein